MNDHTTGNNLPDRNDPAGVSPIARHALAEIVDLLEADKPDQAVCAFTAAIADKHIPDDAQLSTWLVNVMGKRLSGRLIEAFASHPCFYCNGGQSPCHECAGHGRMPGGKVCETCLGLGVDFCDFCNASGWMTMEFVPKGIRLAVVAVRTRFTSVTATSLLETPLPKGTSSNLIDEARVAAKQLVQANRIMGMLENVVIAFRQFVPVEFRNTPTALQTVGTCDQLASVMDIRTKEALASMLEIARLRLAQATNEAQRELAHYKVEFYHRLAEETLSETKLAHPCLRRRIRQKTLVLLEVKNMELPIRLLIRVVLESAFENHSGAI